MSRSFVSASASNGTLNLGGDNFCRLTVKITLKHNEYSYNIEKSIKYHKKMPLKIDYRYC